MVDSTTATTGPVPGEPTGEELGARFWSIGESVEQPMLMAYREGRADERAALAAQGLRDDDPADDYTDAAHPAWWRGQDAGVKGERERAEKARGPRGPRPENPHPGLADSHHEWQHGFDTCLVWALSGESDELARLRAELATERKHTAALERNETEWIERVDREREANEQLRAELELARAATNGANNEREFLLKKLRDAEASRDELSDHLDLVKAEHDQTRGYRQHAELLLADMTAERDTEKARADRAEANYRFMVERAADEKLDGYRELGQKAADAENALTLVKARIAEELAEARAESKQHLDDSVRALIARDDAREELASAREAHAKNRAEWIATTETAQANSERYLQEMTEAREELRLMIDLECGIRDEQEESELADLLSAIDGKPSPSRADSDAPFVDDYDASDNAEDPVAPEQILDAVMIVPDHVLAPPYETAPTLTAVARLADQMLRDRASKDPSPTPGVGWVTREGTAEGPEHPANTMARKALEAEGYRVLPVRNPSPAGGGERAGSGPVDSYQYPDNDQRPFSPMHREGFATARELAELRSEFDRRTGRLEDWAAGRRQGLGKKIRAERAAKEAK